MAYGNNPTTTTQGALPVNQFPASSVYPPNTSGSNPTHDFKALGGGPIRTDDDGNAYSEALMYIKDGDDETLGAKADTAATSGTGSWSAIALLKGILAKLLGTIAVTGTFWQATQPVSATSLPLPTGAALEAGHLATVDTSNAAINTTTGAKADSAATDSTSAWSVIALLKGIFSKLAGTLGIQQADLTATGTISAAQPVIGTPVSNATVQLALGQGQSSWMAQLTAGAGFTSATTIVVDQTIDGGTTWFVTNFKVSGSLTNTPVQSVVGPGPLLLSGDAASKGIIRIRCSVLNASETINVQLRSGAGVGSVGLLSSIPAGSNYMGYVEDIEQASYIAATSPPSATNVGTDTPYTFSSQVNRVIIQNNTSVNLSYSFDSTASAGSLLLVPGAMLVYPKKCTVLHLFTAAAQNLNGTTASNIVVLGAL